MTNQIQIFRALSAISTFAISANFASCQLSRLAWFFTREAFSVLCGAALTIWQTSQPQVFAAHHLASCPVAALHCVQSALHAVASVL